MKTILRTVTITVFACALVGIIISGINIQHWYARLEEAKETSYEEGYYAGYEDGVYDGSEFMSDYIYEASDAGYIEVSEVLEMSDEDITDLAVDTIRLYEEYYENIDAFKDFIKSADGIDVDAY